MGSFDACRGEVSDDRHDAKRRKSVIVTEWIYAHTPDNSARFVLGTVGDNPLVCVGVNPSTAAPGSLDRTVSKLQRFAMLNGHDSWVMLNLYPQRATKPQDMHATYSPELKDENERQIAEFIGGRRLELLAAWGETIRARSYLSGMLRGIVSLTEATSCGWRSIGAPLKTGHPRHPSRASYAWPLHPFDVQSYLRGL